MLDHTEDYNNENEKIEAQLNKDSIENKTNKESQQKKYCTKNKENVCK